MTTFKFIRSVLRTMEKTKWKVYGSQEIRTIADADCQTQCPLSFVATVATGRHYTTGQWQAAAAVLGMDRFTRDFIVAAADGGNINFRHHEYKGQPGQRLRRLMKKSFL